MKLIWLVVLAGIAAGCAGQLRTQPLSAEAASDTRRKFDGIIYHPGQYVKLTYEFTTRTDSTGRIIGRAIDKSCTPVLQKEEVQIMPDYNRAYLLSFKPRFLSDGKFAVGLDHGMLASVNAETTSQVASELTAVAALTTALRSESEQSRSVPPENTGLPYGCNAAPGLTHMTVITLEGP